MKKVILVLCLLKLCFPIYSSAQQVDSLFNLLQTNIPDTTKIAILTKICKEGVNEADGAKAIKYCNELIVFSKQIKDTLSVIRGYGSLSQIYMMAPLNVAKIKSHAEEMIVWSAEVDNKEQLAQAHLYIGISYLYQIDSCVNINVPADFFSEKAKKEFEKSAELFEKAGNKKQAAIALSKIGDIYNIQGLTEQSLTYYSMYFEKATEVNYDYGIMNALIQIGSAHYTEGSKKSLETAIPYLEDALEIAYKLNYNYQQLYCKKTLFEVYERLGDYENALAYHKQWLVLDDSISGLEKAKQIQALETQFETEKKELTIANQKSKLSQSKRTQTFAYVGIGLLGIIAFLFYRTALIRKKNNEKLESRNREIESQKIEIEEKNKQNEMLVREIHHRVKNNLQVISSLLNLQSMHIDDEAALGAVKEGQGRVKSMALLHQNLYQGDNLASIEMQEYVGLLLKSIGSTFGLRQKSEDRIRLINKVKKQELDVDHAIPLGLIINELVTNALKYAFPDGRIGKIEVSLKRINEDGRICLQVSDDGIGISNARASENSTSFGTKLMKILTKKLKGEMEIVEENGTVTSVYFSEKKKG